MLPISMLTADSDGLYQVFEDKFAIDPATSAVIDDTLTITARRQPKDGEATETRAIVVVKAFGNEIPNVRAADSDRDPDPFVELPTADICGACGVDPAAALLFNGASFAASTVRFHSSDTTGLTLAP